MTILEVEIEKVYYVSDALHSQLSTIKLCPAACQLMRQPGVVVDHQLPRKLLGIRDAYRSIIRNLTAESPLLGPWSLNHFFLTVPRVHHDSLWG